MIRFYFHHTPNPMKVALFLEETATPYEVIPVDTLKGEQHTAEFRAINPNDKTPAIVDTEGLGEGRGVGASISGVLHRFPPRCESRLSSIASNAGHFGGMSG